MGVSYISRGSSPSQKGARRVLPTSSAPASMSFLMNGAVSVTGLWDSLHEELPQPDFSPATSIESFTANLMPRSDLWPGWEME